MIRLTEGKRPVGLGCVVALVLLIGASAASAETLMMPNRDLQLGVSEVVWGLTTLPNTTSTFSIDFGDGTVTAFVPVTDRSYINLNHTYTNTGTVVATLTVHPASGPEETASVTVRVFDRTLLTDAAKRGLDVNRAIENGLRFLWTNDALRTSFDTQPAFWQNQSFTGLVVLAFENHGYKLTNDDTAPTGLYEKYVVQRGLNRVLNGLTNQTLGVQTHLDPCVGVGIEPAPCIGFEDFSNNVGYSTAIASLPLSGSSALQRHVGASLNANVANKTYGEVLQRLMNAVAWGQVDSGISRGGWAYGSSDNSSPTSDSSVVGWNLLALFDGVAAGAISPAAVKTEFGMPGDAFENHRNDNDGSFDYNTNLDESPDGNGRNLARTSIGLQGLSFIGETSGPRVDLTVGLINQYWLMSGVNENPPSGSALACGNGKYNKGCGYGMFNTFKALKLLGISTLSNVNRPAGSFGDPQDWYADYLDWLIANQSNPTTATGGQWTAMYFSSSGDGVAGDAALAELILAPVALISPDPGLFSTVGLSQGNPLSQLPATNTVGTSHTVTALVESATQTPIAGATVGFTVSGTNAGVSGACLPAGCVTGANGVVTFTYPDTNGVGDDTIQANIGNLQSNVLIKHWVMPTIKCDVNGDGKVTMADLLIIRAANGQAASGPNDPRDANGDGAINIADVRFCQFLLTPP